VFYTIEEIYRNKFLTIFWTQKNKYDKTITTIVKIKKKRSSHTAYILNLDDRRKWEQKRKRFSFSSVYMTTMKRLKQEKERWEQLRSLVTS